MDNYSLYRRIRAVRRNAIDNNVYSINMESITTHPREQDRNRMDNNRKAWISELSPEEAQHELNILGAGSWDADQINAYWMNYGAVDSIEESWAISENYADGLADDHGHHDDLIEYLRAIVASQDITKFNQRQHNIMESGWDNDEAARIEAQYPELNEDDFGNATLNVEDCVWRDNMDGQTVMELYAGSCEGISMEKERS